MAEAAISIQGLTKDFSVGMRGVKLRAVDNLSLEVGDNEIFGLLGPNGCGKSTTIKIVLGLLRASQGVCRIFGEPSHAVVARKSVGFLPEAPYFYRYLSGRELVRFYAKVCGVPRAQMRSRVDEVIELVNMTEAANRRVGTYSKGMLQRIGLAQALVHDPRLVILDEPTAGVDPLGSAAIAQIIRELKAQGKTVLVSSHLLAQIEGLCDRVAILHRGRLIREGTVDSLLQDQAAESLVVEGLSAEGRAAVEAAIQAEGGRLRGVEKPRVSLDSLFLQEVNEREEAHQARQSEKEDA
ncbi:ABC transporter ATP-binding protein [Coraliomargarita akajimensis]|uniref:ABC transporter related protein n=1 Tax=Coraliomargarita akajimensis (strain DSM 45221 / IAM 15411 / JCM 23193 / KCTC 12865 / 04OKA010-24) TaxID=583355 RepID=D5EPS9_CORAD|nr:ABC transporter ATP-binding protein [Coraliomargarita akajimensis]ADE55662.1 ABC transporter related protein [Coraliomargarita akajimensis DSM 45221]